MERHVHILIAGCGTIARTHSAILSKEPGVTLSFASRDAMKAEEYRRKFAGEKAFGSYEEALRDPVIDAAVICTPHDLHVSMACAALSARKHVIVEKPIARNVAEARQILKTAEREGRHLLVAENHHFKPSLFYARSVAESGILGTIKWIRVMMMYRRLGKKGEWRVDPSQVGGGPLIDGGIHWVHELLTLGGGDASSVTALRAPSTDSLLSFEDTMLVQCRLQNGAVGTLTFSWGLPVNRLWQTTALFGSEGSLHVLNAGGLAWLRAGGKFSVRFLPLLDWRGFRAMWRSFLATLREGTPSPLTGSVGLRDLEFVEAAYASAQ